MRSCLMMLLLVAGGCHSWQTPPQAIAPPLAGTPQPVGPAFIAPGNTNPVFQSPQASAPNPGGGVTQAVFVPVTNEDYAWEQIVDVVDDYFRIDQENRVQMVGNVITEGRIDTFPEVGSTMIEPNRFDSVGRYNLVESTFQSIRRRAEIRVIPQQGGWLVDAIVYKELEDLPRPENATAGAVAFRNDNSLQSRVSEQTSHTRLSDYWIPLGRDCEIEQEILSEIRRCLTTTGG